jgi:hypothetical protein
MAGIGHPQPILPEGFLHHNFTATMFAKTQICLVLLCELAAGFTPGLMR